MIKVLYTGNNLRSRRREYIKNPPQGVQIIPLNSLEAMPEDHKLTGKIGVVKNNKESKIRKILSTFQYPNLRFIKYFKLKEIDLINTPGQIILNQKDYCVEIDNVACLALYDLKTLNGFIGKQVIKKFLKKKNCKKIICISEAGKKSVINLFKDKKIEDKCVISYPFVSDKKIIENNLILNNYINLLFISSDFYLKGGREAINVFEKLSKKNRNLRFTIITKLKSIDKKDLDRYEKIENINLVEANLNKEELYKNYYLKSDLFVMPTYQDSFGLVFLEALSCGLGIITTNMFATPEMITQKNGILLKSPVNYFNSNYLPNPRFWGISISDYVKNNPKKFEKIEKELFDELNKLLKDKKKIFEMKKESIKLYKEKFHDSIRKQNLKSIFEEAMK